MISRKDTATWLLWWSTTKRKLRQYNRIEKRLKRGDLVLLGGASMCTLILLLHWVRDCSPERFCNTLQVIYNLKLIFVLFSDLGCSWGWVATLSYLLRNKWEWRECILSTVLLWPSFRFRSTRLCYALKWVVVVISSNKECFYNIAGNNFEISHSFREIQNLVIKE